MKKEPIGIQLHPLQVKAALDGATALLFMVSDEIEPIINDIDKEYGDCLRYKYKSDGHISIRSYEEFYKEWCPLQVGQKFYVQEEFIEGYEDVFEQKDMMVFYKSDNPDLEWCHDPEDEPCTAPFLDPDQMKEHQSRLKDFTTATIEVKRVQDISHDEIYSIYPDAHKDGYDNFMHGFNEKHCGGTYESNPYVFIVTYEKDK